MASPEDVAAAFDRVDALLVAAKETAPSVAWLVDRAAANGIWKTSWHPPANQPNGAEMGDEAGG